MSPTASETWRAPPEARAWLAELLGVPLPEEGGSVDVQGCRLTMREGILRAGGAVSSAQAQTRDAFAFKWVKRETFEGAPLRFLTDWLREKYGDVAAAPWLFATSSRPILLDAGCGAAASALALFEPVLHRVRYLGVDVSAAVDVARSRFAERGLSGAFMQADLMRLPLPAQAVDLVFAEGVLHHTDDTRAAMAALARPLKPGGRFLFYVYRKKGPVREFTDDYIRAKLQTMTPAQGWQAMMPLTKLGRALGELDIDIDVPERIELLDIPAGRIKLQRLFYWHVLKAFYRPDFSLEEMNHINFDWFAPKNAHRHTPDEVRAWCDELALEVERERIEEAGIAVIARKR